MRQFVESRVPEPAEELNWGVSELPETIRAKWDQGYKGAYFLQSLSTICIKTNRVIFQNVL